MLSRKIIPLTAALLLVASCAVVPTGPDVMVLPGTGKSFEEFRMDDTACRDYAFQQIGGQARAADQTAVSRAAIGTAVGAVAGAAIGGRDSAGVGAGTGLVVGSMMGTESARYAGRGSQNQYDAAYVQCMYAKGHRVPVSGAYSSAPAPAAVPPPPPPGTPPPPPR